MLALSIRSLTLAYFVMSSAFGTVSESMDSAARAAGASWWTSMTRIAFPILRPALYASFILLFISILNDYDPALFSSPQATKSWASRCWTPSSRALSGLSPR